MRNAIGAASEEDVQKLESMIKDTDKRMAYEHESIKRVIVFQDKEINDNRIKANILTAIVALQTFLIAMMAWVG